VNAYLSLRECASPFETARGKEGEIPPTHASLNKQRQSILLPLLSSDIHPQGELISADEDGNVLVWDLAANACSHELVRITLKN
jgi:hypothetical protein